VNDDLRDYVDKWLFRAAEDMAVIENLMQSDLQGANSPELRGIATLLSRLIGRS